MNIIYLFFLSNCLFICINAKKVSIHRLDEKSVNNQWKSFRVKHNKLYHNNKFNDGTVYHSLEINQFGDWVNMSKNKCL